MDNSQESNSSKQNMPTERLAALGSQGQIWKFLQEEITFERPIPLFDKPFEITLQMLRGLRMVDETVVIHDEMRDRLGREED